jgi:hypothetical protein
MQELMVPVNTLMAIIGIVVVVHIAQGILGFVRARIKERRDAKKHQDNATRYTMSEILAATDEVLRLAMPDGDPLLPEDIPRILNAVRMAIVNNPISSDNIVAIIHESGVSARYGINVEALIQNDRAMREAKMREVLEDEHTEE